MLHVLLSPPLLPSRPVSVFPNFPCSLSGERAVWPASEGKQLRKTRIVARTQKRSLTIARLLRPPSCVRTVGAAGVDVAWMWSHKHQPSPHARPLQLCKVRRTPLSVYNVWMDRSQNANRACSALVVLYLSVFPAGVCNLYEKRCAESTAVTGLSGSTKGSWWGFPLTYKMF